MPVLKKCDPEWGRTIYPNAPFSINMGTRWVRLQSLRIPKGLNVYRN